MKTVRALLLIGLILGASRWGGAETPATAQPSSSVTQRISLDLKGVDILDVLKLLSQKTGLNFIAGHNVSGRVTLFVNDVDAWDAFELIIGANDLAYDRRGTIVTVMTARDYELIYGEKFQERTKSVILPLRYAKAEQVAVVANQIKSSVGKIVADEPSNTLILTDVPSRLHEIQEVIAKIDRPTTMRVYSLNYAEVEKLKDKIQTLLSPAGSFTFDARTNKAVVSDTGEVLEKVDRVIRAFDAPDGEVLIESKIVKVELTDEMSWGIDWQRVLSGVDTTARSNFRVLNDIVGGSATGAALRFLATPSGNAQIILEALQKIAKTDTLSSPRIMVSNNQEARILIGTKEAVVTTTTTVPATGSTITAPSIQYVDVGTKLYVTPNIKRDGHIQMKIHPEVSTATVQTFQTNRIPIVTSTEAETNVLVKSGTTLIIGGLIETKDDRTRNQLPLLGNIPIIGLAFKSVQNTKKKTELVVFLTPQIILPDGSPYVPPASPDTKPEPEATVTLKDPVPPSYRAVIRYLLQNRLSHELQVASLPRGSVAVSFILSHDGRLVGEGDIASPQGERFIEAAKAALAKAQPFPPFPEESEADQVRFRLAVEYAPGEGK